MFLDVLQLKRDVVSAVGIKEEFSCVTDGRILPRPSDDANSQLPTVMILSSVFALFAFFLNR